MKKVLVTGGAGYIGSHTVISLKDKGFYPVIVDDLRSSSSFILEGLSTMLKDGYAFHCEDVCNVDSMTKIFREHRFDAVIHFAAYKSVGESCEEPLKYYQNNLQGLTNILRLCEEFGVPKFVFSSSCTVYGEPEDKQVYEHTPKRLPESPYGFTKWMGEQIIEDVHRNVVPFQTLCLRYFNPIGAHPSGMIGELPKGIPNNLLPYITQTATGVLPSLTVFGDDYPTPDGTCIRDYIHVCDVADAHVKALLFSTSHPLSFFNIGTGYGTSVLEMVRLFERVSGKTLPYSFGKRRKGDVVEIFANVTAAQSQLGWKAKRTIEEAIRDAWNWEQRRNKTHD